VNIGCDGEHRRMSSALQGLSKSDHSRPANRLYPQRLTNTCLQSGSVRFPVWEFKWNK
jgi:hypothetical protein